MPSTKDGCAAAAPNEFLAGLYRTGIVMVAEDRDVAVTACAIEAAQEPLIIHFISGRLEAQPWTTSL